eukprot:scaffold53017_cov24-Prasinocladus_malaysianus.AAC.1
MTVDLPTADPERAKLDIASRGGLELEEYGGDVQVVEVAAPTGLGLKELEESLLLQVKLAG